MDYRLQGRTAFITGGAKGHAGGRFEGGYELLAKKETNEIQHSHPFGYQESIDSVRNTRWNGNIALETFSYGISFAGRLGRF